MMVQVCIIIADGKNRNRHQTFLLGLFVTWPTSYEALVGRAELKPGLFCLLYFMNLLCSDFVVGEWVLVTAAAGGVGIAATQLAKGLHVS
jgi:E3 ubiquitin-protein ligase HUWE1